MKKFSYDVRTSPDKVSSRLKMRVLLCKCTVFEYTSFLTLCQQQLVCCMCIVQDFLKVCQQQLVCCMCIVQDFLKSVPAAASVLYVYCT